MLKTKSIFKKKRSEVSVCYKMNIYFMNCYYTLQPPPFPQGKCALHFMCIVFDVQNARHNFSIENF